MTLSELQREHQEAIAQVATLRDRLTGAAAADGRELGPGEVDAINRAVIDANRIKQRIDAATRSDATRAAIERLTAGMTTPTRTYDGLPARGGSSLGAAFINSATYAWLREHRGRLPVGNWTSPSSELGGVGDLMATTLTEDPASGGKLVVPDYRPGIVPLPTRPVTIAALCAQAPTDSNLVTYMKETTFTNAAATVAEGAAKPESALVFDSASDPVRKIAHWLPITEEILEDVPALRGYVGARLQTGLELTEDNQLLNGTVTPPDIVGFLNRTGLAPSIARTTEVNADTILSQIMAIWTATNLMPTGIVLHPNNWLTILKTKDTQGVYIGGGPFASPRVPTLGASPSPSRR